MPNRPPRSPTKIQANPRHLARARYEQGKGSQDLATLFAKEILRIVQVGRIPWSTALMGLSLAQGDIEDRLAEESLSWAENFQPCYPNERGRMPEGDGT